MKISVSQQRLGSIVQTLKWIRLYQLSCVPSQLHQITVGIVAVASRDEENWKSEWC